MKQFLTKWFDTIHMGALIISAPLFIFPKPHYWWILSIIPIFWLLRKTFLNKCFETSMMDIPLLIFLSAIFITTLRVTDFSHSLPKIAGVLFAISIFYALTNLLKTEKLLKRTSFLFIISNTGLAVMGLLGMPTFKEKHLQFLMNLKDKIPHVNFNLPGAEAGFAPTVIGGMLLLSIPLIFTMCIFYKGWKRGLMSACLAFILGVVILTQARGAWSGILAGSVITGSFLLLPTLKKKKKLALSIAIPAILLITSIGFFSQSNSEQLKPGIKQAEGTLLFRVQLWDLTVPVIRENPWIGIGLNNFRTSIPEVRFFLSHAHNQFLHIAVELGIPAMLAFMSLLMGAFYMCFQVWKHTANRWMRFAALGLGWGLLSHVLFCLTDCIPPGSKVGLLFWISLALITAIYKLSLDGSEFISKMKLSPESTEPGCSEKN